MERTHAHRTPSLSASMRKQRFSRIRRGTPPSRPAASALSGTEATPKLSTGPSTRAGETGPAPGLLLSDGVRRVRRIVDGSALPYSGRHIRAKAHQRHCAGSVPRPAGAPATDYLLRMLTPDHNGRG